MRQKLILLLLLSNFSYTLFAQRAMVDSMLTVISKAQKNDTSLAKNYVQLAFFYYQVYSDSTIYYAEKGYELSKKLDFESGMMQSLNRMAVGYASNGKLPKAVDYYLQSLRIAEKLNDPKWISSALNNLGYTYRLQKDYKKSLDVTEKSLEINLKMNNTAGLAVNYTNIAWVQEAIGDTANALKNTRLGLLEAKKVNDQYHVAIAMHIAGKVYLRKNQLDSAKYYFENGLINARNAEVKQLIAHHFLGLGQVESRLKLFDKSLPYLRNSLIIAQEINVPEIIQDGSLEISRSFAGIKKWDSAYYYYNLYSATKEALFSREKESVINQLNYNYELQKQQEKLDDQRKIIWLIGGFSLVLLVFAYSFFKGRQKQRMINKQLLKNKADLMEKTELLEQGNQMKSKIISIIAHDLRAPMATLKNTVDIMDPEIIHTEELEMIKTNISAQLDSIDKVLQNLLKWSTDQMQHGSKKVKPTSFLLNETIQQNINLLHETANRKKITIHNHVKDPVEVFADETQISVVIRNLLSNAIKFTPDEGEVSIHIRFVVNKAFLMVQDSGLGMSQEIQSNLFKHHINNSTRGTNDEKGIGLGLHLCKEFIERNQGELFIESQLGKGSTFSFSIPRIA